MFHPEAFLCAIVRLAGCSLASTNPPLAGCYLCGAHGVCLHILSSLSSCLPSSDRPPLVLSATLYLHHVTLFEARPISACCLEACIFAAAVPIITSVIVPLPAST
uniref:Secreted protein n=1 Tax=Arundo donax TaxID=35708 RepID=A0A0A9EKU8_ARUDO